MHENDYIELINRFIDGNITRVELDRLNRLVEEDPEVRKHYHNLVGVSRLLGETKEVDPPPTLKQDILKSLPAERYPPRKENLLQQLKNAMDLKFRPAFAYGFIGGALVGVVALLLIISSFDGITLDKRQVTGTFIADKSTAIFTTADRAEINLDGISGAVETKYADDIILVELGINSSATINLILEYDGENIGLSGFERMSYTESLLDIDKNQLILQHQGQNQYRFIFDDASLSLSKVKLKIYLDGLAYEKLLNARDVSE